MIISADVILYIRSRRRSTSLAFGRRCSPVLRGAAEADKLAAETDVTKNAAMLDALIGVYERNVLGIRAPQYFRTPGIKPFPAHLQQLDMESNGKSVNRLVSR